MGIFGKILPWKRREELGMNENIGLGAMGQGQDLGLGGLSQMPSQMPYEPQPQYPQFGGMGAQRPQMEAFQQNQSYISGKEIEIVSAKLDAIKSALEALNQRLANVERCLQTEQEFKKRGGW